MRIGLTGHIGRIELIRPTGLIGLLLLTDVFLAACSDGDQSELPIPMRSEHEMGFTCSLAEPTRGAVGEGEFTTEMLKTSGFGVYCWYTGTTSFDPAFTAPRTHIKDYLGEDGFLLMNNQKVEWKNWNGTGNVWGYTPTKYWPINAAELLTLRAYAPYVSYNLQTDANGMPMLPVVVKEDDYHNGTQHDPLWGTGRLVLSSGEYDPGKKYGHLYNNITYQMSGDYRLANDSETRNGTIDWYFHHGMSCLMFTCSVIADPGCDKVTITSIEIKDLYTQGLLSLSSPTASESEKPIWDDCSGDMTVKLSEATPDNTVAGDLAPAPEQNKSPYAAYPFVIDITDPSQPTGPINLLEHGLLIIPRNYPSDHGMKVIVKYTIDTDVTELEAVGNIERNFEGNTKYTLGLKLTPSTRGLDIEIVQSAFTPWSDGGTGEHEVYNW